MEQILIEDNAAKGVVLKDGRTISAGHIIANCSPAVVYGKMIADDVPRPKIPLQLANARSIELELETMYIGLNRSAEELGIDTYSTIIISDEDPEVTFTKSNGKDKGTFIANCLNMIIPDSSPKGTCTLFLTTFGDSKEWANVKPEDYYKLKNQRMKEWVDYYEKNTGITICPYIEEIAYATPPFRKRFRLRSMSAARPGRSRPARPIPSSSPWRKTALPRLRTAAPVSAAGAMPA